jgi:hypothetical protein
MKVPTTLQIEKAASATGSKALKNINDYLKTCGLKPIDMARKNRVFGIKKKTPVKAAMKKGAAPTKKRATVKKKSDSIQKGPNGGAGRGQGRKKGAATKRTQAIANKLAESGEITPLEYMLGVLRETPEKIKAQYEAGDLDTIQYTLALSQLTSRRDDAAKNAASYIHPRLSSIEANVGLKGQDLFAALLEKER